MQIQEIYNLYLQTPSIFIDSRKAKKKGIFFSIKGTNFNGNHFAKDAIEQGCNYAIVDEKKYKINDKFILVDNVLQTLQELAILHRANLKIPIIGITGTNGKTTSKELIKIVLESEKKCFATQGNLNNHLGVPLSILNINNKDELAIIEMGANHEGEIGFLCDIAQPTHGVITNIGTAHLEGFKNFQTIINTKNELYQYVKKNHGVLFVNNDDELLLKLSQGCEKIKYGINENSNIKIINNTPFIKFKWGHEIINSRLIGDYQLFNISLAICIGNYFNISNTNIKIAIESYIPENNRSQIKETKDNFIIMDAYNANPSSMKEMLKSFSQQKFKNKMCILGDMLEMGDYSRKEHLNIIQLCKKLNLESIFVGKEFKELNDKNFKKLSDLKVFLKNNPLKNKTILLKGSRGIGLENLISVL